MRVNFLHMHVRETVIILEGGNLPHPWLPWFDVLETWKAMGRRHVTNTKCAKGADQKRRQLAEEETRESVERYFQA